LPLKQMGHLFEQFVILELVRKAKLMSERVRISYWRDPAGPEVDCVVELLGRLIPIEVKYTDRPTKADAKHLLTFLNEYESADRAYVVCQTPRRLKLHDNIYAIPWQELPELLDGTN